MANSKDAEDNDLCKYCNEKVENNERGIQCDGFCERWVHIKCCKGKSKQVMNKIYNFINECGSEILWMCDECKIALKVIVDKKCGNVNINGISDNKIDSLEKNIAATNEKIGRIYKELQNSAKNNIPKVTYAEAVKNNVTSNNQLAAHKVSTVGIIIRPKDQTQSGTTTKLDIKSKITPAQLKAPIVALKNVSKGGIIIKTDDDDKNARIVKKLKASLEDKYTITVTKKRNPCFIINNLDKNYNAEELKYELTNLNSQFDAIDEFKVVHSKLNKKSNKWSLFVETSGLTYSKMINKYVNINWKSHYCKEDFGIRRCYKCQQYNHTAVNCKNKLCCPNCSGEHKFSECECNVENIKCNNCKNKDIPDFHHKADSSLCTEYLRRVRAVQQRTTYNSKTLN